MKKILILLFCLIATNAYSACEKEDFLNFVNDKVKERVIYKTLEQTNILNEKIYIKI